ncbi:MAG: hypothetical protein H0X24_15375 [Ktedonobacterales bacterium]|nr:hypothetical protein [Ktedonobacterales bacterium]
MRQTPQQIRIGGYASIGIGVFNLLIFGILALALHDARFFFPALPAALIVTALGVAFVQGADRISASAANQKVPKKVREEAASKGIAPQSLRRAGTIFAATGGGLFIVFLITALVTHQWSFLLTTVAPAFIMFSMGISFIATDRPTVH